jgi:hypothetical protein
MGPSPHQQFPEDNEIGKTGDIGDFLTAPKNLPATGEIVILTG